jgi:hypothetical protein
MKTHAEFKRALQAEGTRLKTLALAHGGIGSATFYVGQVRRVAKKNTTGVYLTDDAGNGSWLLFDKASDWQINGTIVTHNLGMSYEVMEGAI